MKVVFLQDVPNVAKAGETKEVSDGYGRNFLLPKKLAVLSKPGVAETIDFQIKAKAEIEKMKTVAAELDGKHVTIKAKVGAKKERLHGSITAADIIDELTKTTGVEVDKRKLEMTEPIRHLGEYEFAIKLAKDVTPKIKVFVIEKEKEEAGTEPAEKPKE